MNPDNIPAYVWRGNAYDDKGNSEQAMKDYNKAIEMDPNYANAYKERAIAYDKRGEKAKADADRKKYEELTKKP